MTAALFVELDVWAKAGLTATLWWRDDDAVEATPALDGLLAAIGDVPLALAVVPQDCGTGLPRRLDAAGLPVDILQHGFAHADHAPLGSKKAEFTVGRLAAVMADEVAQGAARLTELFGARFLPVFVPPWNRFPHDLAPCLREAGHRVLSAFAPRRAPETMPGLRVVNTHVDVNDWAASRGFIGVGRVAAGIEAHLRARRTGAVDRAEPTGLLTHHLQLDAADLVAVGSLVRDIAEHPAARWLSARSFIEADPPVDAAATNH